MNAPESFYELTARYPDEASAVLYFERLRWPDGARCTACGSAEVFKGNTQRRAQLWRCAPCGAQFTVTSGTVMDSTKLPLRKWLLAFHLVSASKKGVSALQLSRMLSITYQTAWHLAHRIRATMGNTSSRFSGIVETDETYIGGKPRWPGCRRKKVAVQTIVERKREGKAGRARTIALGTDNPDGRTVGPKLQKHTHRKHTVLMTDDSPIYDAVGEHFADHHAVNHSKRIYATQAPDGTLVTTNSAEGLFANLKRQIQGTHHHTSEKHLPRYLDEYDFKYNTREQSDGERAETAIRRMEGKRLTLYESSHGGAALFERPAGAPAPKRKKKRPCEPRK